MNSKTLYVIMIALNGISMKERDLRLEVMCSENYFDAIYSSKQPPAKRILAYRCPPELDNCHYWRANLDDRKNPPGPFKVYDYAQPGKGQIQTKEFVLRFTNDTTITFPAINRELTVKHWEQESTKIPDQNLQIRGLFWVKRDKIAYFAASKTDSPKDQWVYEMDISNPTSYGMKPIGKKVIEMFDNCKDKSEKSDSNILFWLVMGILLLLTVICVVFLWFVFKKPNANPVPKPGPKPSGKPSGKPPGSETLRSA